MPSPTLRQVTRPWALVVYVVIGIALGVGIAVTQRSDARPGTPHSITITSQAAGARAPAAAVWLFGVRTVRVPLAGVRSGQVLGVQGFGSVLGVAGAVDLFDPDRGTLGRLDATRNRLEHLAPVAVTRGTISPLQPIADTGDALWLVTGPTQITRVSLGDRGERQTIALTAPDPAGVTLAWSDSTLVWSATYSRGAVTLARIDASSGQITGRVTLASPGAPVALVGMRAHVILVFAHSTVAIRAGNLSVGPARSFRDVRIDAVGAATASDRLWVLDRSRASATQVDWLTGATRVRVRVQGAAGTLRAPFGLAGARGSIWVVAPADRVRFGAMTASGIDARSGRVHDRFAAPAALEVGAVAISGRPAR